MRKPQTFAHARRKALRKSSDMIASMKKVEELMGALARNLHYFMRLPGCPHTNANLLHKASGVAANTIRYYLNPKKRPEYRTITKDVSSPSLDKLVKLADALGCEPWELLHPDIEKARADQRTLQALEERYRETREESGVPREAAILHGSPSRQRPKKKA